MFSKSRFNKSHSFFEYLNILHSCIFSKPNSNFFNLLKKKFNNNIILTAQGRVSLYYISKYLIKNNFKKFYISPYTNIEVIEALKFLKCDINFIDINYQTGYPKNIKELLEDKDQKKCLIITHLYNDVKSIDKIYKQLEFRNENFVVIEDSAITLGSKINGKNLGTLFDFGFYSFGKFKNLNLICGGAIYYKDKKFEKFYLEIENKNLIDFSKFYFLREYILSFLISILSTNFGDKIFSKLIYKLSNKNKNFRNFIYKSINPKINEKTPENYFFKFPYFMSNFAVKNFQKLHIEINERQKKALYYYENLKNIESIYIPKISEYEESCNAYIEFPFILKKNKNSKILKFLANKSIYLREHWYQNNDKFYNYNKLEANNDCNMIENNILILPCGKNISKKYQDYILKYINKYFEQNN